MALLPYKPTAGELAHGRTPTAADWRKMSSNWKRLLEKRIRALTRPRDQLDGCIGCGSLSLTECPLCNPGDRLAEVGQGAVLLERNASSRQAPEPP